MNLTGNNSLRLYENQNQKTEIKTNLLISFLGHKTKVHECQLHWINSVECFYDFFLNVMNAWIVLGCFVYLSLSRALHHFCGGTFIGWLCWRFTISICALLLYARTFAGHLKKQHQNAIITWIIKLKTISFNFISSNRASLIEILSIFWEMITQRFVICIL